MTDAQQLQACLVGAYVQGDRCCAVQAGAEGLTSGGNSSGSSRLQLLQPQNGAVALCSRCTHLWFVRFMQESHQVLCIRRHLVYAAAVPAAAAVAATAALRLLYLVDVDR